MMIADNPCLLFLIVQYVLKRVDLVGVLIKFAEENCIATMKR